MDVVRKRTVGVWERDRGGAEIEDKMLPITPWLNCELSFQGKVCISFFASASPEVIRVFDRLHAVRVRGKNGQPVDFTNSITKSAGISTKY